ncbi:MAG: hypothetical protein ACTHU0_21535 [Kofleriaceae bacterium]
MSLLSGPTYGELAVEAHAQFRQQLTYARELRDYAEEERGAGRIHEADRASGHALHALLFALACRQQAKDFSLRHAREQKGGW